MTILERIYSQETTAGAFEEAKSIASEWLEKLRKLEPFANGGEADAYGHYKGTIQWLARDWCFTLADIGTSEEELEEIGRRMYFSSSSHDIEHLRREPKRRDDFARLSAESVKRVAERGGFTLADIGTNEEDLAELSVKL